MFFHRLNRLAIGAVLLPTALTAPAPAAAAPDAPEARERVIVVARSDALYDQLRQDVERAGGSVVEDVRDGGMLVAVGPAGLKNQLRLNPAARAVATDRIERLVVPREPHSLPASSSTASAPPAPRRVLVDAATSRAASSASARPAGDAPVAEDPAFAYPGLMWSIQRIDAPQAWPVSTGRPIVRVGVADTGLDADHVDLQSRVSNVVDFTTHENPPICKSATGIGDSDLAATYGAPVTTDWSGHGTWIGANIAGALNRSGVSGVAPRVKLVSLKISQWCGESYDSEIFRAFVYAANSHIDIVNISFGAFYDPTNSDDAALYERYVQIVETARSKGTLIVAAAGNDHVQVGPAGLVESHGPLNGPGEPFQDVFGWFESPGGVPGVVDVSSTVNVVMPSTDRCAAGTIGSPGASDGAGADYFNVCKPSGDAHQAAGQGKANQLAYSSNYGSRIDVAAPGGAGKFNLPLVDRGGTPGFPETEADLTTAYGDFSATSNYAQAVPCYMFAGGGFAPNQCYSTIFGTSMATPHAAGVLALIASTRDDARKNPDRLEQILKSSARHIVGNLTQVLNPTDTSPGDLVPTACPSGYCHLGGATISDAQAYGAGLVDAERAVSQP